MTTVRSSADDRSVRGVHDIDGDATLLTPPRRDENPTISRAAATSAFALLRAADPHRSPATEKPFAASRLTIRRTMTSGHTRPGHSNRRVEDPGMASVLARYVRQVADEVGVPAEATGYEVSDTATAYLGLAQQWAEQPDRDLMLVWEEQLGWYVAIEADTPSETPHVIAYFDGEAVPQPAEVAQFVTDAVAGRATRRDRPVLPPVDRAELADRMDGMSHAHH